MFRFVLMALLAATAAHADCAAPVSKTEATICGSAVLRRLESQMIDALTRVRAARPSDDMERLQAEWLEDRQKVCGTRLSCIALQTRQRTELLMGLAMGDPMTPPDSVIGNWKTAGELDLTVWDGRLQLGETTSDMTPLPGLRYGHALDPQQPCGAEQAAFVTLFPTGSGGLVMALFPEGSLPADPTPANYHAQPGACRLVSYDHRLSRP